MDLTRWLHAIVEEDVINEMMWNRTKPGRAWFVPDLTLPPREYPPISLLEINYHLRKEGLHMPSEELKPKLRAIKDPFLERRDRPFDRSQAVCPRDKCFESE